MIGEGKLLSYLDLLQINMDLSNENKELKEKLYITVRTIDRTLRLLKQEKDIDEKTLTGYSARDVLLSDCANALKEVK